MISDRMDINRVLAEMRAIKAQTQIATPSLDQLPSKQVNLPNATKEVSEGASFRELMSDAVNSVNSLQKTTGQLRTAYEQGQPGVDITDVMIASQKSSVSFQAMVEVRNKVVEAYRDVMNMPV